MFVLIVSVIVEINLVDAPGKPPPRTKTDTIPDYVKTEKLQPPSEEGQNYNSEKELNVKEKNFLGIPKIYNVIVKTIKDPTFGMSIFDKLIIEFINKNGGLEYIQNNDKNDVNFAVTKEFNENYDKEIVNDHLLEIMNLQLVVYFKYIAEYLTI